MNILVPQVYNIKIFTKKEFRSIILSVYLQLHKNKHYGHSPY